MIPKYEKLSPSAAPHWMIYLQKRKFIEDANLDIRGYKFEFVWKPHPISKDILKHSFHILFYTKIRDGEGDTETEFVAMDETNGNLFFIKYEENHTESATYLIEYSELLDEQRFVYILNTFNNKIPGLSTQYGDYYRNNWRNYLEIKSKQSLTRQCLSISFDLENNRYFYMLVDEASWKSYAYVFSCPKDFYLQWKAINNHPLDDIVEMDSLVASSAFCFKKKLGIFNTKTIRKKFQQLYESSMQSSESNANSGHFLVTKFGLLQWEKYGIPNEALKKTANEILMLVSK